MWRAWSRSFEVGGSIVTNGMSVRSSAGSRGERAASSASSTTAVGNSGATPMSARIAVTPSSSAGACSATRGDTRTTRLGTVTTPQPPTSSEPTLGLPLC